MELMSWSPFCPRYWEWSMYSVYVFWTALLKVIYLWIDPTSNQSNTETIWSLHQARFCHGINAISLMLSIQIRNPSTVYWVRVSEPTSVCSMSLQAGEITQLRDFYSQPRCFHPLGVYTNPPPPFCSGWFPQSTAWPQQSTEMALERPLATSKWNALPGYSFFMGKSSTIHERCNLIDYSWVKFHD